VRSVAAQDTAGHFRWVPSKDVERDDYRGLVGYRAARGQNQTQDLGHDS